MVLMQFAASISYNPTTAAAVEDPNASIFVKASHLPAMSKGKALFLLFSRFTFS